MTGLAADTARPSPQPDLGELRWPCARDATSPATPALTIKHQPRAVSVIFRPTVSVTPANPENGHSREQAPRMTPGNIASTVAQAGGSTPENAELPANYAPADQE